MLKQPFFIGLRQLEQKRGIRFIQGMLTVAENTVQRQTDVYSKRDGYLALNRTVYGSGPAITQGVDLGSTGSSLVVRDKNNIWQRSADQVSWIHKGAMRQFAPPIVSEVSAEAGRRPAVAIDSNGKVWVVWGDSTSRWYSVIEGSTGIVIQPPTKFDTGTAGGLHQARLAQISGSMWCVYWTGASANLKVAQFTVATPATAPTITQYTTLTGGTVIDAWDAVKTSSNTLLIAIVGNTTIGGVTAGFRVSRLDTATGLVDGSGWVTQGAGGAYTGPGTFCANANGNADGNVYFLSRTGASNSIAHHQVRVSDLAITHTDIGTGGINVGTSKGGLVAVRQINGDKWIFTTDASNADQSLALMTRRVYVSGTSHTAAVFHRGMHSVSYPFLFDGDTYLLCGSDVRLERAYYLVNGTTGRIVGRCLYGFGGAAWLTGGGTVGGTDGTHYGHHVAAAMSGSTLIVPVSSALTPDPTTVAAPPYTTKLLTWGLSQNLGPPVTAGGITIFPGAWPMAIMGRSVLSEPVPPMDGAFTSTLVGSGGQLATGNYSVGVLYAIRDDDGRISRSGFAGSATHTVSVNNSSISLTIRTLRNLNQNQTAIIEVYFTAKDSTTLRLHSTIANDQTVDTVAFTLTNVPSSDAEIIYTDGNALSNIALPPCRWAAAWRERIFLGGTEVDGEVWPSHTFESGFSPRWAPELRFTISEGTGPVHAGGAVDFNSFVCLTQDGAWVISGPGPKPDGTEGYTPIRIHGAPGCTNPRSVVTVPGVGLMYQAHQTGEIWAITPALQPVHVGTGVHSHRNSTVFGAVVDTYRKQAVFVTAAGRNLVFDFGHGPDPITGALGRWSTEVPLNASAWTAGVAAVNHVTGFHFCQDDGVVQARVEEQFNDNGQAINQRLRIAPAHPAGIMNWARVYRGQALTEYKGAHDLQVKYDTNGGTAQGGTSETFPTKTVSAAGSPVFEFRPTANKKPSQMEVEVADVGTQLTQGFTFEGVTFEVGIKGGLPRVEAGRKL